jgi:hypothetical protein
MTAMAMPAGCTPANPADIEAITANLAAAGNQLIDAFTVSENTYRFVMANVDDASGGRITSGDLWLFDQGGQLYAVSSGARDNSVLPDGSVLPGNPVASPAAEQMTDCVIASGQQRNLGSG